MSRPGSRTRRTGVPIAPPAAATDATLRQPAVPSTVPLASDQTSAPAVPVAPVAAPVAVVTETAPLPSPSVAPRDPAPVTGGAGYIPVDSTVPLPSDQMTPFVPAVPIESAPLAVGQVAPPSSDRAIDVPGADVYAPFAGTSEGFQLGGAVGGNGDPVFPAARAIVLSDEAIELLRGDLVEMHFDGAVVLSPDTIDALHRDFGLPAPGTSITAPAAIEERRYFRVTSDVEHDGRSVAPGGEVLVGFDDFERLRRGTSIDPATHWRDGERG